MMKDLGELLLASGKLTQDDLNRALQVCKLSNIKLASALVRLGMVAEKDIAKCLVDTFNYHLAEPDDYPADALLVEKISSSFLRDNQVIPLYERQNRLTVAMLDPQDEYVIHALKLITGLSIEAWLGLPSEIDTAFERLYGTGATLESDSESLAVTDGEEDVERLKDMASEVPVIRLVNNIFSRALDSRASDIHIEPFENSMIVRFRIDGVLQEIEKTPSKLAPAVISRLKILSRLNIAERRLPQDGRIQLRLQGRLIDLRISTVPTMHGESVVMRILDKQSINLNLDSIGLSDAVLKKFEAVLEKPNGIFLVTGPTGSGKTTTLYAALNRLNTIDQKILTVEDPVEYQITGVNQIQAASKLGLDFANALRAILRQDPDVVMIGEMRDKETASIAIQAALTGHIVLSTLHTNDAPSAITRLLDMGIEDYLLTSTINGVMAQRLVRMLCRSCRRREWVDEERITHMRIEHLVEKTGANFYQPVGCAECAYTGYKGRMGIHELLIIDDEIRRLILLRSSSDKIYNHACESGMRTMFEDGVIKAVQGHTSLAEVLRVAKMAR